MMRWIVDFIVVRFLVVAYSGAFWYVVGALLTGMVLGAGACYLIR